uniref:Structural maintenance of chromosomes protein 6 n=1 Tax=Sinocyclocheilus rhinocerous TaxID=307959 RepID=A0A673JTM7_9TELE
MSKRKSSNSGQTPDKRSRLSQPEPSEENETGEVGIIESISLRNFMCHSMLGPFEFGPNVNFVVGNNGSGKSAVLTALIVALGGKAHTTNRGSSLKGFVKERESSADVSITLRNRGRDAYKPEVFGQSIIVDLRISSEGMRTYKLRSKTGRLVSSKKEELISILDHFNIQVDNPVSILTQEMSKHFLHSKGEGDKYKFFMKVTQLDQMKEDYSYIMKTKTMTQNTVEKHRETLQELKRKYHAKEERYKSLASLDEMQKKLDELNNQMAWALVRNHCQHNMNCDCMAQIKMNTTILSFPNQILSFSYYNHIIFVMVYCGSYTFNGTFLLSGIISHTNSADTHARVEKMNHIQAELEQLHFQDSTLTQQIDQFKQACSTAKDRLGKMSREKQDLLRAMESKRRDLAAMESSRENLLCRFGEHMPALLRAIDEADQRGQFRKKPVGPLGFCVRLRDPELGLAVECCLKALMLAFCCDNHADERELQRIMSRHFQQGRRPQIIVSTFTNTVYDVRGRAVNHHEYPTVLQALDIENPVVANCLIDMRGIETILLIKNAKDARRVMQSEDRPRNCREAFTREGDQVYYNRYYSSEQNRALYLSRDVEEEIRSENMKSIFEMSGFFSVHGKNKSIDRSQRPAHPYNSDQELERSKHHKEEKQEKRKAHVDMIETLKKNLNEKDQLLQASIAKALEICPERLDVRRTAKSLDSEISRLRHKINTQQDQQGHRDTIVRYIDSLQLSNKCDRVVFHPKIKRKKQEIIFNVVFLCVSRYLSVRCKYYFDAMLFQRGYIGKMTFDHKDETLSISVQPGESGKAALSDMRSLSGGERSFSTVCFVLSLWAIAEAPFRALDEFDVYMDMVNRRISMDMMLKIAASQRYRQFIFLTPQSMSSLPVNRLIRIHRLNDPDRSQSTQNDAAIL